jgi:hypothetical protein
MSTQEANCRAAPILVLSCSLLLSAYLAYVAFEGSHETGAGAAQGDFGFWLILRLVTPITLSVTVAIFLVEICGRRSRSIAATLTSPVAVLTYLNVLGLLWNWVYLFLFWRR